MDAPPSPALLAWATEALDGPLRCIPVGWPHGPSRVWRLERPGHPDHYLKEFRDESRWRLECDAYRDRVAALSNDPVRLPQLFAAAPAPLTAILLTAVPGEVASELPLGEREGIELHRRAGAFLRRLHALPLTDDDPVPLAKALPLRLAFWLERGGEHLSLEEGHTARTLVGDGSLFEGDTRVPCHRDYQLRNWLIERAADPESIGLAVIDFEHSRPDHPLVDFVRVEERAAPLYPSWFAAFVDGYGGLTIDEVAPRLRALSAIHAVGSIVWGARHADGAFERAGHELLARLR